MPPAAIPAVTSAIMASRARNAPSSSANDSTMAIMAPTSAMRHCASTAAAMTAKPILTTNSAVRRKVGAVQFHGRQGDHADRFIAF